MIRSLKISFIPLLLCLTGIAQEVMVPLHSNLNLIHKDLNVNAEKKSSSPVANKSLSLSITIPFLDDFSYAPLSSYPDRNKWADSMAYVNSGYPIAPPSIGVATFDGLNKYGFPYQPALNNGNLALSLPSDTLTSKVINLLTTATSQTLQPGDSLALSFYYQARGYGDPPEITDSLVLDFFSPGKNQWVNRVWFAKGNINGNINDTAFKRGFVWIDSAHYLKDGFKFRFRNRSAATGNYDHWHLDYVYLDKDRSRKADTIYKDITFAYVPTPFLRDYSAMPYEQYITSEMASKNLVSLKNNGAAQVNMTYEYKVYKGTQQVGSYTGGANILLPFRSVGYSSYTAHSNPTVNVTFPVMQDSTDYKIEHYIFQSGASTDFIEKNDTVVQYQRFRNYFALDDGSAEAGYFLNAAMAKVAIKVNVNVADSLLAVRIYFDPVSSISSQTNSAGFRINIWPIGSNGPANTPLYTDVLLKPEYYNKSPDRSFAEFKLASQKLLQPGTYYIGFQQRADYMTVGFDRNTDHRASTYYDIGTGWKQSTEKGSIMIRPVFGKTLPPPVGINESSGISDNLFLVYPNPASEQLVIKSKTTEKASYMLLNAMGQLLAQSDLENNSQVIQTNNLDNGIYFLVLKLNGRMAQQQKIIIQH